MSFLDLIEVVAIGGFKERGFSLAAIRRIVENCREQFGASYPLATQKFKVGGRDAFVHHEGVLHDVLRSKGALAWNEILVPFLETLDYSEGVAVRWWPLGQQKRVVVDPRYGFGLPVIVGAGVRTEIIGERARAGDSHKQIAADFNVSEEDVESALQFELQRAA